jgi:hypothetical protein
MVWYYGKLYGCKLSIPEGGYGWCGIGSLLPLGYKKMTTMPTIPSFGYRRITTITPKMGSLIQCEMPLKYRELTTIIMNLCCVKNMLKWV